MIKETIHLFKMAFWFMILIAAIVGMSICLTSIFATKLGMLGVLGAFVCSVFIILSAREFGLLLME